MGILDKELELAEAMSLDATASTPHQIYLGPKTYAGNASGNKILELQFTATEDATGAGTVVFQVRSAPTKEMTGAKVHMQSRPLTADELKVGKPVPFRALIPFDADSYVDVNLFVTGALSGKVSIIGTTARRTNY